MHSADPIAFDSGNDIVQAYHRELGRRSSLAMADKAQRGGIVVRIPLGYLPEADGPELRSKPTCVGLQAL
jgi:hypothetical protein